MKHLNENTPQSMSEELKDMNDEKLQTIMQLEETENEEEENKGDALKNDMQESQLVVKTVDPNDLSFELDE